MDMNLLKLFIYLLTMFFGIVLFVPLQQATMTTNYSLWTFTGHEAVAAFMPALPYIFLITLLLTPVYFIITGKELND